jgi:hypothetical protein
VDIDLKDLPLENVRGDPPEFLLDEPKDRDPPNDRVPKERPPLPPKLPRASEVNGNTTNDSMVMMKRIYACFMNLFMEYLRK